MKKILSALIFSLLASMISVAPAQGAGQYWQDGDYERICLALGWSDCAVWSILDKDGIEKNRVIGPGSLSDLKQTCGEIFCGGGESATAVKLETIAPWVTPTPTPTPTPSATSTPAPESSTAPSPAPSASPSATPSATPAPISAPAPSVSTNSRIPFTQPCTGGSDRTPGLPQCLMPEGLGGNVWNLVDNNSGVVLNGAVCSEAVCGRNGEWRQWPADRSLNGLLWPNGYPEGATYIQTPFDGAYWGRYFTNGVYEVNGGGIVQPGSSTIVWPVRVEIPRTDTPTVTTESTTSTSTPIQAPVSSGTAAPISTPAPSTAPTSASAPISTPAPSTPAPTSTPAPAPAPTSSSNDDETLDEVAAEEEIIDSIEAVVQSNGTTRIQVSTGYLSTALTVVATKKGSKKKYTYKITTNAEGDRKFKSGLNLRGYTVILYKGSTELDRMFIS